MDIRNRERSIHQTVYKLSDRVASLEESKLSLDGGEHTLRPQLFVIRVLRARAEHDQKRLRQDLVLFGFLDNNAETWKQSEKCIIAFCSEALGSDIAPINVYRAHAIGSDQQNKNHPTVIRFSRFKERDTVVVILSQVEPGQFLGA